MGLDGVQLGTRNRLPEIKSPGTLKILGVTRCVMTVFYCSLFVCSNEIVKMINDGLFVYEQVRSKQIHKQMCLLFVLGLCSDRGT